MSPIHTAHTTAPLACPAAWTEALHWLERYAADLYPADDVSGARLLLTAYGFAYVALAPEDATPWSLSHQGITLDLRRLDALADEDLPAPSGSMTTVQAAACWIGCEVLWQLRGERADAYKDSGEWRTERDFTLARIERYREVVVSRL